MLSLILVSAVALSTVDSGRAEGQETKAKRNTKEIRVFLRVSGAFVERLMDDQINLDFPIDRKLQSIDLSGKSEGAAKLNLELFPGRGNVGVVASVKGNLDAKVNAKASFGSAKVKFESQFTSSKRFTFDGRDFGHLPTQTEVKGESQLELVCSKRSGIIGRVIRRLINRIYGKRQKEIDDLFKQSAQSALNEQMNAAGDSFIEVANKIDRYAEMVEQYFPDVKRGTIQIITTKSHLLAGFGTESTQFPAIAQASVENPKPEVEIWIRTRPVEERFIRLLEEWEVAHDLFKTYLPEEQARRIADNLLVVSKEGWTIIRVGVEKIPAKNQESNSTEVESK